MTSDASAWNKQVALLLDGRPVVLQVWCASKVILTAIRNPNEIVGRFGGELQGMYALPLTADGARVPESREMGVAAMSPAVLSAISVQCQRCKRAHHLDTAKLWRIFDLVLPTGKVRGVKLRE